MMTLPQGRNRRWSGNDRHFGPITWSRSSDTFRPVGIVLDSGDDEDSCHLRVYLRSRTMIIELPPLIEKYRRWIDTSRYEWSKPGGGHWEIHSREFGFQYHNGFLQLFLGPQTHDSVTTKSWSKHLPWTQWRHVRFALFDLNGKQAYVEYDRERKKFEERRAAKEAVLKARFEIADYDGQVVQVETHIEEREYRFGEGWFKWLSLFRRARVYRSLDIKFNKEVGPEKGSWKGGMCGHSIEMLPGELHEAAFRRYCEKEQRAKYGKYRIKFLKAI
jgi:hypothetical protein